ncbi:MAG: hypothetical protein JSW04_04685 [Desulfobacterales bacterium]|nr:MAG: hypothetical protein JSW04_04685 [Desulfobacterales bacterium]
MGFVKFPDGHRYYRLIFNIFSILTTIPVVFYSLSIRTSTIFRWHGNLRLIQAVLILMSFILIIAGAAKYDFNQLLGFSQIRKRNIC